MGRSGPRSGSGSPSSPWRWGRLPWAAVSRTGRASPGPCAGWATPPAGSASAIGSTGSPPGRGNTGGRTRNELPPISRTSISMSKKWEAVQTLGPSKVSRGLTVKGFNGLSIRPVWLTEGFPFTRRKRPLMASKGPSFEVECFMEEYFSETSFH